jgi:tetratricopeptide (TPR) repeat protein
MNALATQPPVELSADQVEMIMAGRLGYMEALGVDRQRLLQIADVGYHALVNGAFENALKIFKGLVAILPRDPVFNCYLAATYVAINSHEEALTFYGRAIENNPRYVDALAGRGELLVLMRRQDEGVADLKKAIGLDPAKRMPSVRRAASALQLLLRKSGAKPVALVPAKRAGKATEANRVPVRRPQR